jgi:hypothetical protein
MRHVRHASCVMRHASCRQWLLNPIELIHVSHVSMEVGAPQSVHKHQPSFGRPAQFDGYAFRRTSWQLPDIANYLLISAQTYVLNLGPRRRRPWEDGGSLGEGQRAAISRDRDQIDRV